MDPKENRVARIFLKLFRTICHIQFQLSTQSQINNYNSTTFKMHLDLIELAEARVKRTDAQIEELKTTLMLRDAEIDGLCSRVDAHESEMNGLQAAYGELLKKVRSIG
jgi:chromosome segregation ATPase